LAGDELGSRSRRRWMTVGVRRGSWVYPIKEDPDHKGAGCSGPAVQAGSGLTVPGLAEVASCRSHPLGPTSKFQLAFHLHARRNAFHRRDARLQSRFICPLESIAETHPQLQPALLRLSAMISQDFTRRSTSSLGWQSLMVSAQSLSPRHSSDEPNWISCWVFLQRVSILLTTRRGSGNELRINRSKIGDPIK